jgi:hypothetical protein
MAQGAFEPFRPAAQWKYQRRQLTESSGVRAGHSNKRNAKMEKVGSF